MKSPLRFIIWIIFATFLFATFGFALGLTRAIKQDYFAVGYVYLAFFEIYRWVWNLALFGIAASFPAILLSMIIYKLTTSRARAFLAGFSIFLAWPIAYLVTAYLIQLKTLPYFGYLPKVPFNAFDVIKRLLLPFFVAGAPKFKGLWSWLAIPYLIINIAGIIIGLILQFPFKWVFKRKEIKPLPIKYFGSIGIFGLIGFFMLQQAIKLSYTPKIEKPNIVFISVDTLRADHVGLYGYERNITQNIDALGGESVVFKDVLAPSPWTLPSHGSMLSGHTPMVHGAIRSVYKVNDDIFLLPEILKQKGYQTIGIVSVFYLSPGYGFSAGFDYYFFLPMLIANQLVDMSIKAVSNAKRPFFLFLHLFDPHWPYTPPDEFRIFSKYKTEEDKKFYMSKQVGMFYKFAKFILDASDDVKKEFVALYDGEVLFTDHELGRLFEFLKQANLWDNTIIVLTSDHGEEFYDHGFWGHTFFLYQESIHVPLIIKPQKSAEIKPKWVTNLVGLIDIPPTILELIDYQSPKEVEGKSLLCLMKDECKSSWTERYLTYTSEAGCSRMAIRDNNWKYLQGGWCKFADVDLTRPDMLFNLENDPKELKNIVKHEAKIAENMKTELDDLLTALAQKWPIRYQKPRKLPKQTEEQLKALGYMQ